MLEKNSSEHPQEQFLLILVQAFPLGNSFSFPVWLSIRLWFSNSFLQMFFQVIADSLVIGSSRTVRNLWYLLSLFRPLPLFLRLLLSSGKATRDLLLVSEDAV